MRLWGVFLGLETIYYKEVVTMKLIMESWNKFINESKDVFKSEKLDGKVKGKVIYRVRHTPSGYTIPVQYYVSSSKNVKALVKFLNQHLFLHLLQYN